MTKLEVLRKSELFRNLDEEQLSQVEKTCTNQVFKTGSILAKQESQANKVYVIEEGTVAIILEVGPLSQRQVQAAGKFEIVGWSALIDPYIYTATVKALETSKVLALDGRELGRLFRTQPEIGYKVGAALASVVAKRLSHAYAQLLGIHSAN